MSGVSLLAITPDLAAVLDDGPERFETTYAASLGGAADLARTIIQQTLAIPSASSRPWGGYLGVDDHDGVVIGTCAFKAAPTSEGEVEIAYFTFPEFEGRGYATAMARELIALAREDPSVRRIVAHTLPEPNASTRVLQRVGMRFAGEVVDPEDGRVWRWELLAPAR